MKTHSWFSIAALISLVSIFVFVPFSDTAAGGSVQTVSDSVGHICCGPQCFQTPFAGFDPSASCTAQYSCPGNCFPTVTSKSHSFSVTPGVKLDITVPFYMTGPGMCDLGVSFTIPQASGPACEWVVNSQQQQVHYSCISPESGLLTVIARGIGSYTITVTELGDDEPFIIEDPETVAGIQRINHDAAIPYIVYVPTAQRVAEENTQFIDIWHLDENAIGQPLLNLSKETLMALPEFPAANMLIATSLDGLVNVYKLTTGEYQVNIGPLDEGKVYTTIFDGIPPTHTTNSTWVVSAE